MCNFELTDFVLTVYPTSCILLVLKATFFTLNLSNLNPEDEVSSPKIDRLMTDYISKLKWAWQAQFLNHDLVIFRNCVSFKDKQMILVAFFDISTGFRFPKKSQKPSYPGFEASLPRQTSFSTCGSH